MKFSASARVAILWVLLAASPCFAQSAGAGGEAEQLNQKAVQLANQGKLPEALSAAKQALALREQSGGEKHVETAQSLNNVGVLLQLSGKGREALPYIRRAVAVYREVRGPEHAETLQCLNSLGFLEAALGDLDAAKKTFEQLLDERLKAVGRDHADTASALDNLGEISYAQGTFDEARKRSEEALEIRLRVRGEKHAETAITLNRLGLIAKRKGDYRVVEKYWRRALDARLAVFGEKHSLTAESINNMGVVANHNGNSAEARRCFERALKIQRALLGEKSVPVALGFYNLAGTDEREGNLPGAEQLFERSLALRRELLGEKHALTVDAMTRLASVKRKLVKYAEARKLLERALEIDEETLGNKHHDTGSVLYALASLRVAMNEPDDAQHDIDRALPIQAATSGTESGEYARSLAILARLQQGRREFVAAKATADKRLAIYLKLDGPDHQETAAARQGLGLVLVALGDYKAAQEQFEASLQIYEKTVGPEHKSVATLLVDLGDLAIAKRQHAVAKAYYLRALEIRKQALGLHHADTASVLQNLASSAKMLDDLPEARKYAEQALEIRESLSGLSPEAISSCCMQLGEILGDSDPSASRIYSERALKPYEKDGEESVALAAVLYSMGGSLWHRSELEAARPYLERALKIQQEKLGDKHHHTAATMTTLALTLHQLGEMEAARGLFEKSLAIHREVLGIDHPDTGTALHNLGLYHGSVQAWSAAAADFDEAQRIGQRYIARELPALGQREQLLFLKYANQRRLNTAVSLARLGSGDQSVVNRSAGWVLNDKAVIQEAMAESTLAARDSNPQLKTIIDERDDLRARLSKLTVAAPLPDKQRKFHDERAELIRREDELSKQLALATHGSSAARGWVELASVRDAMPRGSVLIEVLKYQRWDFSRRTGRRQEWRYAAWVIPHAGEGEVRFVDLGLAILIEAEIARFRKIVDSHDKLSAANFDSDSEVIGSSLDKLAGLAFRPLLPAIGKAERLIVSPDASLWLVPWEALPLSSGSFAVERYKFSYVLSGRDLAKTDAEDFSSEASLIMADPDYNATLHSTGSSVLQALDPAILPNSRVTRSAFAEMPALPVTRVAARALLPKLTEYLGKEPQLLLGEAATEAAFKAARAPRILFVATHGYHLPADDDLAGVQRDFDTASFSGRSNVHPLLRCGLALAGANANKNLNNPGIEDGILTGLEIVATDLRGTELVVLDACQTGLGDVRSGEGLAGLSQAFQLAGCRTVVGSLWSVSSTYSAALMIDFCRNLAEGQNKADALRNAELAMIRGFRAVGRTANPRFWAPFTVTGRAALNP